MIGVAFPARLAVVLFLFALAGLILPVPALAQADLRYEDLPAPEIQLAADVPPEAPADGNIRTFGLPDGRVAVLALDDLRLQALHSGDQGASFAAEVGVAPGEPVLAFAAAADGAGRLYAAYLTPDPDLGTAVRLVRSEDFGRTWSASVLVAPGSEGPGDYWTTLDIEATDGGVVAILWWITKEPADDTIYVAASADRGATFTGPAAVDGPVDGMTTDAALALAPDGSAVLVAFTKGSLYTVRSLDAGETWEEPVDRSALLAGASGFYGVDAAFAGTSAVVALDCYSSEYKTAVLQSADGGATWSMRMNASGSLPSVHPVLAVSGSTVLLHQQVGGARLGLWRSGNAGVSWGLRRDLVNAGFTDSSRVRPLFAKTGDGRWIAAWRDDRNIAGRHGYDVFMRTSSDDGLTWTPEARVTVGPDDPQAGAGTPAVAAMGPGDAVIVFPERRANGITADVHLARVPARATAAGAAARIDTDGPAVARPFANVVIGTDRSRRAYTAGASAGVIYAQASSDGGQTYGPSVAAVPSGALTALAIAAEPDGRVYLAYQTEDLQIAVTGSQDFGASWPGPPAVLGALPFASTGYAPSALLAAPGGGRVYVLFSDDDAGSVYFARSTDGAASFEVQEIDDSEEYETTPALCAQGDQVFVAWVHDAFMAIRSRVSTDGGATFGPPDDFDSALGCDEPVLACDGAGGALLVWNEGYLRVSSALFDGAWSDPGLVRDSDGSGVMYVDAAYVAGTDTVLVTWNEFDDVSDRVAASRSVDGGWIFSPSVLIDDVTPLPSATNYDPEIATDGAGNAWVSFLDCSQGTRTLVMRRTTDGGESFGPALRVSRAEPQGAVPDETWGGISQSAALRGAGLFAWMGQREAASLVPLTAADAVPFSNGPPVADAGDDQALECSDGQGGAPALLDGTGSYDPDSGDAIASYGWGAPGEPPARFGATVSVTAPLGTTAYQLTVTDEGGLTATDDVLVTVADTVGPQLAITAPAEGACVAGPVSVEVTAADACRPEVEIAYEPAPGPLYSEHGDYTVTVTARDLAGNASQAAVTFWIDLVPPAVQLDLQVQQAVIPGLYPFTAVLTASDDDGVRGGIVHETLVANGCVLYDGTTFGDGDGRLSDETLAVSRAELCRLMTACGFERLQRPAVHATARDACGNESQSQAQELPISVDRAAACAQGKRGPRRTSVAPPRVHLPVEKRRSTSR